MAISNYTSTLALCSALTAGAGMVATSANAQVTLQANHDVWISNDTIAGASTANNNGETRIQLRDLIDARARLGLFSFDLSEVTGDLSGAFLTVRASDPADGHHPDPINRDRDVNFYAVNDGGANEIFDEATVNYQTAPGFDDSTFSGLGGSYEDGNYYFNADMNPTPVGTFNTDTDVYGDYSTATTTDLDNAIAADTNGTLSISMIVQDGGGSAFFFFHSKEFNGSTGPRLVLPNATMVANDPADLDGDGDVDDADFGIAFAAFTGPNMGPSSNPDADLDGDGDVDDADFGIAFAAFTGPNPASVPEPTSLALLCLGGLIAARRRRG